MLGVINIVAIAQCMRTTSPIEQVVVTLYNEIVRPGDNALPETRLLKKTPTSEHQQPTRRHQGAELLYQPAACLEARNMMNNAKQCDQAVDIVRKRLLENIQPGQPNRSEDTFETLAGEIEQCGIAIYAMIGNRAIQILAQEKPKAPIAATHIEHR